MNSISAPTRHLLALSRLQGVGLAALRQLSAVGCSHAQTSHETAAGIPEIALALATGNAWLDALQSAEAQVAAARRHRAAILSPCDEAYPKLLSATNDHPLILYVQGELAKTPERSVAIVGTRAPTAHGQVAATRWTQCFVEQGWSIVSGLAIGCDGIAHQAALDAGGRTVAVVAHGLDSVVPACHESLAKSIVRAGGALVSEYPFGQAASARHCCRCLNLESVPIFL